MWYGVVNNDFVVLHVLVRYYKLWHDMIYHGKVFWLALLVSVDGLPPFLTDLCTSVSLQMFITHSLSRLHQNFSMCVGHVYTMFLNVILWSVILLLWYDMVC